MQLRDGSAAASGSNYTLDCEESVIEACVDGSLILYRSSPRLSVSSRCHQLAMRDTYGLAASGTRLGCGKLSGVVTRGAAGWWLRSHPLNLIQFVLAKGMSVMTYALRSLGGFRCRDVVCWYASGCALAISREARR